MTPRRPGGAATSASRSYRVGPAGAACVISSSHMSNQPRQRGPHLGPSQLYAVIDNVLDALVVTEPSGQIAFMNAAALRLYDVGKQDADHGVKFDLLAHVLGEFETCTLDGTPVPDHDHPLMRALRGETYRDVELQVTRKGEQAARVYVFSGHRVEGDPPLSVLTIRDETDRWSAERRYRVAFEADPAPSVIVRLDDAQILEANEGMAELTGLDKQTLQGSSLLDLRPAGEVDDLRRFAGRLKAGERVHKVKRLLLDAGGRKLSVVLSARSIEIEGQSCGIFTYIDMSELDSAQREQRETQELLSTTIRQHAEERAVIEQLATTDPLTGLANRRGLNARLSEEIARATRYDETFSLLVLDLDHFKRVNDTYGHDMGDRVLREVARVLQEECREPDMAGRWGGEEFIMVLPQSDLSEARDVASRIRRRVERETFGEVVDLTISIGVASLVAGDDMGSLFERADRALYVAKAHGRNRVEVGLPSGG